MKVINLITGLGGGGAEHFILDLIKEINNSNVEITANTVVLSPIYDLLQRFENNKIQVDLLNVKNIFDLFSGLEKFDSLVKNEKKVIIHAHMFHALAFASIYKLWSRNFDLKIIFTQHNNIVKGRIRRILLWASKWLRSYDILFSKDVIKYFNKKNSIVLKNGLDFDRFENVVNPIKKDKIFTFLFLGSLEEQKNPLYLIELAKFLKEKKVQFKIEVVGKGSMEKNLNNKIVEEELEKFIKINGFSNNVGEFFSAANCLIMPSLWEGFPISILEAGYFELPILLTPVGAYEGFLDESNSYLRDIEDFKSTALEIFNNYNIAVEKGKNLKNKIIKEYSIKNIAEKHVELYQNQK